MSVAPEKVSVLAYSERMDLAGELLGAANELAKAFGADPPVAVVSLELDDVVVQGSSRVLRLKGERPASGDPDATATAIAEAVAKKAGADPRQAPLVILIGSTKLGRVVAGRLAAKLRIPSLGGGKRLRVEEDGRLVATREVYAGKFVARVAARPPCIATIQPGVYTAPPPSQHAVVETLDVTLGAPRSNLIEDKQKAQTTTVDLKTAPIIVSAGRGFAKKEDLALVEDLAAALGAAVGASRPISSDLGWMGEERHIGLTGIYVHPKLYLAVGISGQLQHIAGIKDSKIIAAINRDREAPIFQVSDYGIVGDLYQVLPVLTRMLRG